MQGFYGTSFLVFLTLITDCVCVVTNFTRIKNVVPLNGLISRGGYLEKFVVPDLALCASRCIAMSDCRSFFYERNGGICQLHTNVFKASTGLDRSPTYRYYRPGPIVCDAGWDQFEDSCYYFGNTDLPYLTARALCTNMSSHLVQVDSKEENDFLKTKMALYGAGTALGFWNDLFEITSNGQERWRTSLDPLGSGYSDWTVDNPDDYLGKESCTFFYAQRGYAWTDVSCINDIRTDGNALGFTPYRPLCEMDL